MKAITLARVSTEEQREAGNSLPAQQLRLLTYIEKTQKLVLDKEFIFDESAYKEHRKEFDKVIDYILSQKEVVAFCCDKVDRLTRDFLVGLPILEKLRREGKIELHFPSDNLVLHQNSPATDLFHFNIAVSLAQYYSNAISDNVKRAYEKMRRDGLWVSKVPLGYRRDTDVLGNTTIIIDPERGHIVTKLFELYATGNYSLQTIREEAISMGLRTPTGAIPSKSTIEIMLKNTFHCGIAVSSKCPPYPHIYPRTTTPEIFAQCKAVREGKNRNQPKFASKDFAFQGMLTCPNCGCLLSPEMHKKPSGLVFIYYSCNNGKGLCDKRVYLSEKTLLQPVYELLGQLEIIDEGTQEYLVQELRKSTEAEVTFHKTQITRIRIELDRYTQKNDGLLDALIDKSITKDVYDKKHQEYQDKVQLLSLEAEEYEKGNFDYQNTVATVLSVARRAREIFESSEPHEKRAFLNYLLQNPSVQDKKLTFTVRSPFNLVLELSNSPVGGAYRELNPNRRFHKPQC
jgi:site-specific DNA recombinase